MKQFLILFALVFAVGMVYAKPVNYNYKFPVPGSELNQRNTAILLKSNDEIYQNCLQKDYIRVIGTKGEYKGQLTLASDRKTLIFTPDSKFSANDIVTVFAGWNSGLKTINGDDLQPLSYSFAITPLEEPITVSFDDKNQPVLGEKIKFEDNILGDTIPADFPNVIVNLKKNPSPGLVFLSNNSQTYGTFMMMLNDSLKPYKYKRTPRPVFDFKVQSNGYLSYQLPTGLAGGNGWAFSVVHVLDTNLNIIDEVQCKSGYICDFHDFVWAPNGHYFLISYDAQPYDMSKEVEGGNPNAIVIGAIVQELDADKNLVFQWRSWDHIPFDETYVDLTAPVVDYMHINAVEFDWDGNILISSRMICEITKINRKTGDIMWRLGGKRNDFTFINEHEENAPTYFSEQHDMRRQKTGTLTIFDNGNQHLPEYSRAVEYKLDEASLTATMVWEFRHTPDIVSSNQGSVQRLQNGNTIIGWGGAGFVGLPAMSEVSKDNELELEISLPKGIAFGQSSYRAYKFPWIPGQPYASIKLNSVQSNNSYDFADANSTTGVKLSNLTVVSGALNSVTVTKYDWAAKNVRFENDAPYVPVNRVVLTSEGITSISGKISFKLSEYPWIAFPDKYSVFYRPTEGNGVFKKLSTTYDNENKVLVSDLSGFGEFIFGMETTSDLPKAPLQIKPLNKQKVNANLSAKLTWSAEGLITNSEVMIGSDQNFETVVDNKNDLKETFYSMPVEKDATYFWKVRVQNANGWSPWSTVRNFTATSPYINVLSPNGGEIWVSDSINNVISWDENTAGNLKIELFKDDSLLAPVFDTVLVKSGGIFWKISRVLPDGNKYKIKISSLLNSNVSDMSDSYFAIRASTSVENDNSITSKYLTIQQIYPNPATSDFKLSFDVVKPDMYSIRIIDIKGVVMKQIPSRFYDLGLNELEMSTNGLFPGEYLLELSNGRISISEKIQVSK